VRLGSHGWRPDPQSVLPSDDNARAKPLHRETLVIIDSRLGFVQGLKSGIVGAQQPAVYDGFNLAAL